MNPPGATAIGVVDRCRGSPTEREVVFDLLIYGEYVQLYRAERVTSRYPDL